MKTATTFLNFYNYKRQSLWLRNGLKESRLLWLSFWSLVLVISGAIRQKTLQYVTLGCLAGREVYSNDRHFVGLVALMVSPVFWWAHLFFDHTTVIQGWYYKNLFFWFFTNREELMIGFGLLGFFLLCPTKWGYRYLLTPVVALCFSEIIYQSFQISHWTHFYNPMWSRERGWQLAVLVLVGVFSLYKAINYAVYRRCHLDEGNKSRIVGVVVAPKLSWGEKEPHLEKLKDEYNNYNSRV